jgi:hypothetical protein
MAEPFLKPMGPEEMRLIKEGSFLFGVATAFFLLWGWLTSIDAVAWLLACAIITSIMVVIHWFMMDTLYHGLRR